MKKFKIQMEFYGKYLQTSVKAENINEAKQIVKDRINFITITEIPDNDERITDFLNGIVNGRRK